jgi:ABC-type lipopolysaccharide export system ATPase subunit
MEAPTLEARHLVKRFFGTAVVSDVSFEVRAGEVVGYLPGQVEDLAGVVQTSWRCGFPRRRHGAREQ